MAMFYFCGVSKNAESKFVEMGFEKCSRKNATAKNYNIIDFCTFALF
jgi:hypothetical protein